MSKARHFLETIDAPVAPDIDLHLIFDNYGIHKTPVRGWLADIRTTSTSRRRARRG